MNGAIVRPTDVADLDTVMAIYDCARARMAQSGNPGQWIGGYPSRDKIADDIAHGNSYVILLGGKIAGVFTFVIGEDHTYKEIDGSWLNDRPYGTIHRIAAAPGAKGVADICLAYCLTKGVEIRIDTHRDNAPMLGWIQSRGFEYCGIIICDNGTTRKAFQYKAR